MICYISFQESKLGERMKGRELYLRRLDTDYRGVNLRYEAYRFAYLERIEEVVEAPSNNYVVVKRNEKRNYARRDSYTS